MLVYYYNPKGMIRLGEYQVYGIQYGKPPTDIPWEIYQSCQEVLVDANYREDYLTKKFHKKFPKEIAFKVSELRCYPERFIMSLLSFFMPGSKGLKKNRRINRIKHFLKKASPPL